MTHGHHSAQIPTLGDFIPETIRGTAGFFRVGKTRGGRWWLLDPFDRGYFAKAVAGVNRSGRVGARLPSAGRYAERVVADLGEEGDAFLRHAISRLRGWHFNTLGAWVEPGLGGLGMYFTEVLDFKRTGPCIHLLDMFLPDVFDPAWVEAIDARARELCAPLIANRELIGYFTDDGLGWAQGVTAGSERRPTLLQLCLSLEPSHRAYHAAWEFVLARHRGSIENLAKSWGLVWTTRENARQLTVAEVGISHPMYCDDNVSFTREYTRRYFALTAHAIRSHDPNHLVLGCRLEGFPGEAAMQDYAYPNVDVVSLGAQGTDWAGAVVDACARKEAPVWFVNASWASAAFLCTHPTASSTPLERMLRLGRKALRTLVADARVVGYEWETWADRENDAPPFGKGLVHVDDHEGREHTDLLTFLNGAAEGVHGRPDVAVSDAEY